MLFHNSFEESDFVVPSAVENFGDINIIFFINILFCWCWCELCFASQQNRRMAHEEKNVNKKILHIKGF